MSVKFKELLYEKSVKGTETIRKDYDEKSLSIFDFLNQIWTKKEIHQYDKKIASAWMLTNWLSHDFDLIDYVQKMNKIQFGLTDEQVYKYYFYSIPKKKRYIKWLRKDPTSLKREKEIEKVMAEFEVSKNEAMIILKHKERIANGN